MAKTVIDRKRKSYMRFVKKGIEHLKCNNSKNSWKWIKTHTGVSKNKSGTDMVYKKGTTVLETEPNKRLDICLV